MASEFDRDWHRRATQGDRAAQGRLFDATFDALHAYVSALLAPRQQEVSGVITATYATALQRLHAFDPDRAVAGPVGWLVGIARNEVRRVRPAARRQPGAAPPAEIEEHLQRLSHLGRRTLPSGVAEGDEVRALVAAALALLPAADRDLLTACHLEGRALEEVAATTGRTPSAVRSHAMRARKRFRAAFEGIAEDLAAELRGRGRTR